MTISLCGNLIQKNEFLKKLIDIYLDNIVVCDIFNIKFHTVINTESIKYKLIDNCKSLSKARKQYQKIIDETTHNKIKSLINDNKDKIIVFVDNDYLTKGFTELNYFVNSDLKILFEDTIDDLNYDKSKFDYIFSKNDIIDIKRLVK